MTTPVDDEPMVTLAGIQPAYKLMPNGCADSKNQGVEK
jgi:hypothetical protein